MISSMLRLLRTAAFRYAAVYALLFSGAVGALGLLAYQLSFGAVAREADRALAAEIESFRSVYETQGLLGLRTAVRERAEGREREFYLLVAPNGRVVAGNLSGVPPAAVGADGAFEFVYEAVVERDDDGGPAVVEARRARGVWARFQDEAAFAPAPVLLIARDIGEREALRDRLRSLALWGAGVTAIIGLAVGLAFGGALLRRVDAINAVAAKIRAGDLSSRIRTVGDGDELDRLADNLNAMLDQIERLMTGMRQVSDNVAHDLRSPLTRMRSRLENALSAEGADLAAVGEDTIADIDRMLSVFNALLAIARIESGEGGREAELVDVRDALESLADLYEPAAREAGFALSIDADEGAKVRVSRTLLSQAVSNLVDNALKYAKPGGRIVLEAKKTPGGVTVAVADDGPGVAAADRERVFDRFVRLEASRTSPGSGLGLSLVAAIARAYRAKLEIGEGIGSAARPGLRIALAFEDPSRSQ